MHVPEYFNRSDLARLDWLATHDAFGTLLSGVEGAPFATHLPVIYARKTQPITMMSGVYKSQAPSHTKGGIVELIVSPEYLKPDDCVILIDDFLASGKTIAALAELIEQCNATLCGIGCIIEKSFEGGRDLLTPLNVPIVSLAIIESMEGQSIVVRDGQAVAN